MGERARRLWAPLIIVVAVAIFYSQLIFQRLVVGDYDAFVYFYPLREYAAHVLAGAGFPLWNPFLFMGSPFFANVQTAVLYPLNLLFMLVPTPYAFSASVVGHVLLASAAMYLFGRYTLGLAGLPSVLGALVFSMSGFISFQVSHINQLSVSAWLPALLVVFDVALRRRSLPLAVAAGFIGTIQLLAGHTQEWYFSTVTLGMLALWRTAFARESGLSRLVPMLFLASAGIVEIGVAAIQWMPTLELSSFSIRGGGLPYGEAISFSLPPTVALYTLLPSYPSTLFSEYIGYVGVVPLVLAAVAVARWRSRPAALAMAALAVFGLVMAFGGYNPIAPLMFKWVPGLSLFRVPARWLLVYTFAVSGLAAIGAQQLLDGRMPPLSKEIERRASRLAGFAVSVGMVGVALGALGLFAILARPAPPRGLVVTWAALALVTAGFWVGAYFVPRLRVVALVLLLLATGGELWAAGGSAVYRHAVPSVAYAPNRDSTSYILGKLSSDGVPERVLSIATDDYEVKETPDYKKDYAWLSTESLRQFLVDVKLSETLAPNTPLEYGIQSPDGYDGGILPLRRYAELKEQILPPSGAAPDSLMRNNLQYVPPEGVLDLLGVKYVLAEKIRDATVDNVYYDRGISVDLKRGEERTLARLPGIKSTSIGVLSSTLGARSLPDGSAAGTLVVTDDAGKSLELPLRLGSETAETRVDDGKLEPPAHKRPREVPGWPSERGDTDYFTKISLPAQMHVKAITIRGGLDAGTTRVRAITLIDDAAAQIAPLVLSDNFDRELFFDMKVYSYRDAMPRSFMVYNAAVRDDGLAVGLVTDGPNSLRDAAWIAPSATARSFFNYSSPAYDPGDARITSYAAEKISVRASAKDDGYLVLADSYFPGWAARVDGKESPIERVDFAFRGVFLPKGEHTVVFEYAPATFRTGAAITVLSLLMLCGALLAGTLRGRASGRML